jgi:3-phenylpropionate/cinnamic acid dioxygenase small subunit
VGQDRAVTISIEDRLAIYELISLHGHIVDDGEFDRLCELFTDDVVYDLTPMGGQTLQGTAAIKDASLKLGDGNPIAHHVTNIVVNDTGDPVTARSKAIGIRKDGSAGSLVYDDVLVRTDAGWRISNRRITLRRDPLTPHR